MVYAILAYTADWDEHNKRGNWSMKVHKGLGNPEPEKIETDMKEVADDETEGLVIILGIVFGLIILVAIIAVIFYYLRLSRRPSKQPSSAQKPELVPIDTPRKTDDLAKTDGDALEDKGAIKVDDIEIEVASND